MRSGGHVARIRVHARSVKRCEALLPKQLFELVGLSLLLQERKEKKKERNQTERKKKKNSTARTQRLSATSKPGTKKNNAWCSNKNLTLRIRCISRSLRSSSRRLIRAQSSLQEAGGAERSADAGPDATEKGIGVGANPSAARMRLRAARAASENDGMDIHSFTFVCCLRAGETETEMVWMPC